jgi:hypothetical protein
MKHPMLILAIASGGLFALAGQATAQFYPGGGGYGGWGGTNGSAALLGSAYTQATTMQIKSQSMQANQQAAMQQNMVVQSGIRSTLSNQAQAQDSAAISQQQSNQDWWFQHQAQQNGPRGSGGYVNVPPPDSFAPMGGPPPVNMDIIKWPTLLQEQCFASERTKIEAPYRRGAPGTAGQPKFSTPTPADYRSMAGTVADMEAVLEWRLTEGADTGEYNAAKAFLVRLGQELAAAGREI